MDQAERAQVSAELFDVLARIVHRTAQDAAVILRRNGLNPAQFQLLRAVDASPGLTQAELGLHRGVTPGGVSQLVGKLVALGLIRRQADGAANRLWLTDRGRSTVDRLVPDHDTFFARRFAGLEPVKLEQFGRLAVRVLGQLADQS